MMQYRQLGKTGLLVSRLCFGTMTFGGTTDFWKIVGESGQREANQLVSVCMENGINFFDTADMYSMGDSEKILGKAIGAKRKDVVIATKVHSRMGPGPNQMGQSRVHIMQAVENSLSRLGTDYIDLYQIHNYDSVTPFEESLRTFDDLIRQGKVRYIGCSNLAAWQIMKALGISELHGWEKFVSVQSYYSLAGRDLEREIVPLLKDQNLGLLTWSPLAGGFLSGKYTRTNEPKDGSRRTQFDFPPIDLERSYSIIDELQTIAKRHNTSVAAIALAWQLHQPFVTSVIIGAKKMEQLKDNLKATEIKLSSEEMEAINAASELKTEYPIWMQRFNSDRVPVTV